MDLQDRIASLNGRTVQLVIRQDRPGFNRLIGISVLQSAASAVLAPSLRHVANVLALTWRRRLTTAAHSRYFRGNTFYTTSQLAGQLFGSLALWLSVPGSLARCMTVPGSMHNASTPAVVCQILVRLLYGKKSDVLWLLLPCMLLQLVSDV